MCYSAQVVAEWRDFKRATGSKMDVKSYVELYWYREHRGSPYKWPKAMDASFANPATDGEREIKALIDKYDEAQATKLQQELFKQKKRLADAERTLLTKTTKKAQEDQRIATDKIAKALEKLEDLRRTELKPRDSRIFPGWYAPVMIWEDGQRVVKPMRYQCRPAGMAASIDFMKDGKPSGTYNARRDKLELFWRNQFGYSHGIMMVNAFFENVSRHAMEHRELAPGEKEENVILEFRPEPPQTMFVACLWSHWKGQDEELLSFAAITDEPPAEVAAAGHDRCIIQIKPENIDAWLNPDPGNLAALYAILDDRALPFYQHRKAA